MDGQFLAPRVLIGLTLESPHVPTTPQIKLEFLMTADKRLLTASKSLEDSKQVTISDTRGLGINDGGNGGGGATGGDGGVNGSGGGGGSGYSNGTFGSSRSREEVETTTNSFMTF